MVTASIDNTPVSVQLGNGESVTVPNGETWKVTIAAGASYSEYVNVKINGSMLMYNTDYNTEIAQDIVVTAGDQITNNGADGCCIQGFKV